jgi:GNAT superfamily N-acetyltransferase
MNIRKVIRNILSESFNENWKVAYNKWKRENVTLRGMKQVGQENGSGAMLGSGLYMAPLSNKALAKQYGDVHYVLNGKPKNPLVFKDLNLWEMWEQNFIYKTLGFKNRTEFNSKTDIATEIQKLGHDGVVIKGREMVNYAPPDNLMYFQNDNQLIDYYERNVENQQTDLNEGLQKNNLKSVLNSDEAYAILDASPASGTMWTEGGCAILAFALNKAFGYQVYVIYDKTMGQVDHFVAKTPEGLFVDYYGPQKYIVRNFKQREMLQNRDMVLKPYEPGINISDIVIDEKASEDLANLIKSKNLNESEVGNREDVEDFGLKHLKVIPHFDILNQVSIDWGRDSSLYNSLLNYFLKGNFSVSKLAGILKNYDVFDDYKHFLNLNEENENTEVSIRDIDSSYVDQVYKLVGKQFGTSGMPSIGLFDGNKLIGAVLLDEDYLPYEYRFDIVVNKRYRNKGYSSLLIKAIIEKFKKDKNADQLSAIVINKKLLNVLEKKFDFGVAEYEGDDFAWITKKDLSEGLGGFEDDYDFSKHNFNSGDCDIYAVSLHRLYGYPLYVVRGWYLEPEWGGEREWDYEDSHVVVKLPNGKYLDSEGETTEAELRQNTAYSNDIQKITFEPLTEEEALSIFSCEDQELAIKQVMKYIKSKKKLKEETQQGFDKLEQKLLSLGGEKVAHTFEEDLDKILTRGQVFDGKKSQIVKMRDSKCHTNSSCFWKNYSDEHGTDEVKIVTGWALSPDDKTWRQHTWVYLPGKNKVIETTVKRDKYFGFILNDDEAEDFYWMNW